MSEYTGKTLKKIDIKAFAKINLMLDIIAKRCDNYHDLFMVMQSVGIYDIVTLEENTSKNVTIECDNPSIPLGKDNIAYKAADLFYNKSTLRNCGLKIKIKKNIPHDAGLAGGSADGAAVLVGLNYLNGNIFDTKELCNIGAKIGADVPFCILGGTKLAQGIGDVLSNVRQLPPCYILLAKPFCSVNTTQAYSQFDSHGKTHTPNHFDILAALESSDLKQISDCIENVFEQFIDVPDRIEIKEIMRQGGALGTCMSGSGPTIYGIFDEKHKAENTAKELSAITESVFLTRPIQYSCKIN